MAGTTQGGQIAAAKNKASDPDFYKKIGAKGGKAPHVARGFQLMSKEKLSAAGKLGGSTSRRKYKID